MDRLTAANEVAFRVGFSGYGGHLLLEPLPPVYRPSGPLSSLPDFVLPPAFPQESTESMKEYLVDNYLTPELDSDEFSAEKSGGWWEKDWLGEAKVHLDTSAPRSVIAPSWELPFRRSKQSLSSSGTWVPNSVEIKFDELLEGTQSYGSVPRMPGSAKDFVRGSINNRPFCPGGLDSSQASERNLPEGALSGDWVHEVIEGGPSQSVPPSLRKGLDLGQFKAYPYHWKCTNLRVPAAPEAIEEKLNTYSVQFDDLFNRALDEIVEGPIVDGTSEIKVENVGEDAIIAEVENSSEIKIENVGDDATDAISEAENSLDKVLLTDVEDRPTLLVGQADNGPKQEKEVWALVGRSNEIVNHFHELVPDMAINFPFELDNFQKEAIYYLEKGDSVFVAAHTSAGKTVVAEYAFALASKHCTRAVYTAPIKTISNQKYRDFCGKFDVGLLTGDVSLKPEASCLIMTTEILRSMLYKGADIIRDIEWVIFDEVHYVNDAERGVVWEEVIIMLPKHINIVLLSATVPNAVEFADWIGRTRKRKIRVTGTTKRPVPLEHCLLFSGELYKVCEKENFIPQGFKAVKDAFKRKKSNIVGGKHSMKIGAPSTHGGTQARQAENAGRGRTQKHSGQFSDRYSGSGGLNQSTVGSRRSESSFWLQFINKLLKNSLLPVVIFCFSKNRCDRLADDIAGTDLTSNSEKSEIRLFCDKAFSRLKGSDRNLPQIVRVQSLLRKGIGVHHAGLLPIAKEVVEMLFCHGVIKVLFSTETFAMGVNAPARTVAFDALRKFDGKEFRRLLPGEYIQMAGRAGRRGLDDIGTVIIIFRDEIPEESDLKHVMVGKPTQLESQFRLTYTMILHLLRVEELKVEDMLKRSFAEFHAQKNLPEKERLLLQKLHQSTKSVECIKGEPAIEEYYDLASESEFLRDCISEALVQSHTAQQFLSPGRVVVVRSQSAEDNSLGVILKSPSSTQKQYIVLILTQAPSIQTPSVSSKLQEKETSDFQQGYFISSKGKRGMDDEYYSSISSRKGTGVINIKLPYHGTAAGMHYIVRSMEIKEIVAICDCKIKVDQVRLLEEPNTSAYSKTVQQLLEKKPDGSKFPPPLDAVKDLKLKNMDDVEKYQRYNKLLQRMAENKCHGCIKLKEHYLLVKEQKKHQEEVNSLRYQMSDQALQHMPDFHGRIDVLKEIHCIDSDLVVQLKGRVACEMNSGEELICTECLFDNQLDDLEPEEAVAIMSAFVFQQKNTSEPNLSPKLAHAKMRLHDTAIRLGHLQAQCNVAVNPDDYARDNLKFGLVEVVYEWAKGTPFADICQLTDVPEGLIVRTIVRLDEICREFKNAASIMGNSALHNKMETASNAIKRDIVFAASLYVTGVESV